HHIGLSRMDHLPWIILADVGRRTTAVEDCQPTSPTPAAHVSMARQQSAKNARSRQLSTGAGVVAGDLTAARELGSKYRHLINHDSIHHLSPCVSSSTLAPSFSLSGS
ncbi:hypothetical protein LSAT2_016802, partial [Lamellibrachia satsuma]